MKEEIKARVIDRQPCTLLRKCSYTEAGRRRGNSSMRAKGREWGGWSRQEGLKDERHLARLRCWKAR